MITFNLGLSRDSNPWILRLRARRPRPHHSRHIRHWWFMSRVRHILRARPISTGPLFCPRQVITAQLIERSLEVIENNRISEEFEDEGQFPERVDADREYGLEGVGYGADVDYGEDYGEGHGEEHDGESRGDVH